MNTLTTYMQMIKEGLQKRKESTVMSKFEDKTQWRVGYNEYDTYEEAKGAAQKRALKDWEDVPVWKTIGFAKSTLLPTAVTWTDLA